MSISLEHLEFYILVLVRISGFILTAPLFSLKNVPQKVKVGLAVCLTIIISSVLPYESFSYDTVMDYVGLVLTEMLGGVILGFFANVAYYILSFAGQTIDMEIGFSMASQFDPITSSQVTITGNLYMYAVMIMLIITDMHHYIIKALADSFTVLPVGTISINPNLYHLMATFIKEYFILGFRIVLPMFAAILVVNVILGILAKVAPQMNMFVIGMQLKIFVGFFVLIIMFMMLRGVADAVFNEMMSLLKNAVQYLSLGS